MNDNDFQKFFQEMKKGRPSAERKSVLCEEVWKSLDEGFKPRNTCTYWLAALPVLALASAIMLVILVARQGAPKSAHMKRMMADNHFAYCKYLKLENGLAFLKVDSPNSPRNLSVQAGESVLGMRVTEINQDFMVLEDENSNLLVLRQLR